MKTLFKLFIALLTFCVLSAPLASAADAISLSTGIPLLMIEVSALAGFLFIAVANQIKGTRNYFTNGIVLEVWARYLIERFWKDNGFLKNAYDDSQYVVQGRIVHIPQPGSKPAVVVNRSTFPATAVRRTDTDITYALDEYSTDPTHIPNIDAIHLSYNKQDSVLGDHMSVLDETVADSMLIKWAANGTVYHTTGGSGATEQDALPGSSQTGTRYALHHTDLANIMYQMNINKVPKDNRNVLIDDWMYKGFYESLGDTNARDFSRYADAANGIVGRIHGFNVYTRSSVLAATNADAIKALGAALAATDSLASFAWQKNSVAFAIGDTKLFQDKDNPLYYGDVYSSLVMAGGRVRRSDGLGVYNIIQGTPA